MIFFFFFQMMLNSLYGKSFFSKEGEIFEWKNLFNFFFFFFFFQKMVKSLYGKTFFKGQNLCMKKLCFFQMMVKYYQHFYKTPLSFKLISISVLI